QPHRGVLRPIQQRLLHPLGVHPIQLRPLMDLPQIPLRKLKRPRRSHPLTLPLSFHACVNPTSSSQIPVFSTFLRGSRTPSPLSCKKVNGKRLVLGGDPLPGYISQGGNPPRGRG